MRLIAPCKKNIFKMLFKIFVPRKSREFEHLWKRGQIFFTTESAMNSKIEAFSLQGACENCFSSNYQIFECVWQHLTKVRRNFRISWIFVDVRSSMIWWRKIVREILDGYRKGQASIFKSLVNSVVGKNVSMFRETFEFTAFSRKNSIFTVPFII